jgi:hypothetical protein
MMSRPVKLICLIVVIVLLALVISKKCSVVKPINVLPLACIACLPLGWCIVVREHSALHAFFTHRIIAILIMAIGMMVAEAIKVNRRDTLVAEKRENS